MGGLLTQVEFYLSLNNPYTSTKSGKTPAGIDVLEYFSNLVSDESEEMENFWTQLDESAANITKITCSKVISEETQKTAIPADKLKELANHANNLYINWLFLQTLAGKAPVDTGTLDATILDDMNPAVIASKKLEARIETVREKAETNAKKDPEKKDAILKASLAVIETMRKEHEELHAEPA